jgi:hypothetical protein
MRSCPDMTAHQDVDTVGAGAIREAERLLGRLWRLLGR